MEEKIFEYPNINETAFSINLLGLNLNVQWYGLSYIAGILLAWFFMAKLVKKKDLWFAGHSIIERSEVDDLITYMILGIIIGGRLGYCLFYTPGYYFENPIRIIYVWEGGMSFHGGLIGVVCSLVIFLSIKKNIFIKKNFFYRTLLLTDFVAPLVTPGLFFGRIGNFINGELWGRITTYEAVPWAMIFPLSGTLDPRHPSQLYQAFSEGLVLFFVMLFFSKRKLPTGTLSGIFLVGYGTVRFLTEFFREPDSFLGFLSFNLSMGQLLSVPLVGFGVLLILVSSREHFKKNQKRSS